VHQDVVTLEDLPGAAIDIDVRPDGGWVAICRPELDLVVVSAGQHFTVPEEIRFPLIRWVGSAEILLIDARTTKGRDNAYVFSTSGVQKARFCVGDGVADAIAVGEAVVITYFDEGIFGDVPPSHEGLCVFSPDGRLEFGYQSGVRSPVDIADCYCVCAAGRYEACFSPYTGFSLVRLNLKTRDQEVHELPEVLAGASALSTDGVVFYFYGPYNAKRSIIRWRPGEGCIKVGSHSGPLRAHWRGAFLSTGASGYTIVTPGPA
jgi:hypothetical protein